MSVTGAMDVLKQALLLEMRGRAFYEQAAETAQHQAVKDFFYMMAQEEVSHVQILTEQYKALKNKGGFAPRSADTSLEKEIAIEEIGKRITGAGFESAALSAAMDMERRAIKLYSGRAEEATDPEEKSLYEWLAAWETRHLENLAKIDRTVTEAVWHDNRFWSF